MFRGKPIFQIYAVLLAFIVWSVTGVRFRRTAGQ